MIRNIFIFLLLLCCLIPSIYVLWYGLFHFSIPWFSHLWGTVLPGYLINSAFVATAAIIISLLIGVIPAWLIHYYDFPGRRFLSFLQILPLALPAYITAGIYLEAFKDAFFSSHITLSIELGAALSPFAYLIIRIFLTRIPSSLSDVSLTLGVVGFKHMIKLYLPLLAAPILLASALVGSEVVSDYGAAARLGVKTFSLGLHEHWFAMERPDIAAALSYVFFLILLVLAIPFAYLFLRSPLQNAMTRAAQVRKKLSSGYSILCTLGCLCLLIPGLLLPLYFILLWAVEKIDHLNLASLYPDTMNSVATALLVVVFCALVTLVFLVLAETGTRLKSAERSSWFLIVNYILPSTIIGFAFFHMGGVDSSLRFLFEPIQDTRFIIVIACCSRFLPFLLLLVAENLTKMPTAIPDAARSLGCGKLATLYRIILPMNRTPFAAGMLIIFVESVKELNFSLMLQPFDYANISIRVFKYANMHMAKESSVWVLCLVLICIYPIWALSRFLDQEGGSHA